MPDSALTRYLSDSDSAARIEAEVLESPSSIAFARAARQQLAELAPGIALHAPNLHTVVINWQTRLHNHGRSSGVQGLVSTMPAKTGMINGYPEDSSTMAPLLAPVQTLATPQRARTPEQFTPQRPEWWKEGRVFRIWAQTDRDSDVEIHDKRFILLDTKIIEGKGVRVDTYEGEQERQLRNESDSHLTTMALKGPRKRGVHTPSTDEQHSLPDNFQIRSVRLENHSPRNVPAGSYVALPHTYNIPFKYKCEDLGMLRGDSLRQLRLKYILYLANDWHVLDDLRKTLEEDDDEDSQNG